MSRINRDSKIVRKLKILYKDRCQICQKPIGAPDTLYSEAYHLKPLGIPHNGLDVEGNMIIVFPNHHAELDLGCIRIHPETLMGTHADESNEYHGKILYMAVGHVLDTEFWQYQAEID